MITPAGYSGTPLHQKLGVKEGARVLVGGLPEGFDASLLHAAGAATLHRRAHGAYDVVLRFCPDAATLRRALPGAQAATGPGGRCWIAWPKKASGVVTDLTDEIVRAEGLATGWVDVKVCAVDHVWSGLCLMRRRKVS